ncbi:MAG: hypothetical protein R2771_01280 [Saprospiraceae bacterium]
MKKFFTFVFASCFGTLLFFLLLFLVFAIIGLSVNGKESISQKSILHVNINGEFKEKEESTDKFKVIFEENFNPDLGSVSSL